MASFFYILGTASKWSDNELRYSLRSLEENMKVDRVIVAGFKPEWLKGVEYIPLPEFSGNKIARVYKRLVASLPDLPDEFYLMNDDQFLLKPMDYIPMWHMGPLRETVVQFLTSNPTSLYTASRQNTLATLADYNPEPLDFDTHAPFPCQRDLVFQCASVFPFWDNLQFITLYANWLGEPGERLFETKGDIPREGAPVFSSVDYPKDETKRWLAARFPNPSRFEG